jgi:hypothetical protein
VQAKPRRIATVSVRAVSLLALVGLGALAIALSLQWIPLGGDVTGENSDLASGWRAAPPTGPVAQFLLFLALALACVLAVSRRPHPAAVATLAGATAFAAMLATSAIVYLLHPLTSARRAFVDAGYWVGVALTPVLVLLFLLTFAALRRSAAAEQGPLLRGGKLLALMTLAYVVALFLPWVEGPGSDVGLRLEREGWWASQVPGTTALLLLSFLLVRDRRSMPWAGPRVEATLALALGLAMASTSVRLLREHPYDWFYDTLYGFWIGVGFAVTFLFFGASVLWRSRSMS